ncbi:MAG TPA: amidohydrolase family protein [Phaeodactylibacter sp.]|nr:amidohydrolase family protein [Phaeodactylibacter sp.]
MRVYLSICLLCFVTAGLVAQVPAPAPAQASPLYITGATAHLGNGEVIEDATVAFVNGIITFVGTAEEAAERSWNGYEPIDAAGKHLYPGFIATASTLGLVDISAVRATRDYNETGSMNPSLRSLIAYNTDSPVIPTVRSEGVLMAQVAPTGGRISGLSSIVLLDAWNWEDAALEADEGLFVNWPSLFSYSWRERRYSPNKKYEEQVQELEDFMREAQAYNHLESPDPVNLKLEAMGRVLAGERQVYVRAQEAKEILHALKWAKEFGLNLVIVDGRDAWMVAEELKAAEVPVILRSTQSLPSRVDGDIDQPFKTPAQLQEAGVLFGFGHEGFWQQRNLAFQAGQAVGYGLEYEEAVAGLTGNLAKILEIDEQVGTLEVGKEATLFISQGDALEVRNGNVEKAFVQGRAIDLDNVQKELYRKFKQKYEQQK